MRCRLITTALALLALTGCSASSGSETEGITAAELAAGQASTGEDGEEPTGDIDGDQRVDAPDQVAHDPGTSTAALSSCTNTSGYRHGVLVPVCVTTVQGKLVEVHTAAAFQALQSAARADGVSLQILSGFRTMGRQRQLYADYRAGRGNLAAVPGFSNHQSGKALDLNTSAPGVYRWLANHASAHHFRRTVSSEAWHWED